MKKISFENELAELENLLARLNDENTSLEEAVSVYAKAADKINLCTKALQNAKLKVEQIDGQLAAAEEE